MFERATRECATSPEIATLSPAISPRRRRIVSASSSAWVGCSWLPSPALMTAQLTFSDSSCTAPLSGARTTSTSGCMAFRVIAVSIRVSPFLIDDQATSMLIDVRAQPLARQFERGAGARRGLEEQIDDRPAGQQVGGLVGRLIDRDVALPPGRAGRRCRPRPSPRCRANDAAARRKWSSGGAWKRPEGRGRRGSSGADHVTGPGDRQANCTRLRVRVGDQPTAAGVMSVAAKSVPL